MKKISYILILSLCAVLCLGCSHADSSDDKEIQSDTGTTEEENHSDTNKTDDISDETNATTEAEIETVSGNISMNEPYSDSKVHIECTGLVQYDKIEGDNYTDVPANGKVYLVLFLNIINYDINDIYFNAEAFDSSVDGSNISHTFLVNDPEGYPSIFQAISAESHLDGYVVWEVPKNWKELSFNYSGCVGTENLYISGLFSPDSLAAPISFDQL